MQPIFMIQRQELTVSTRLTLNIRLIEKFCGDEGYRKTFVEEVNSQLGIDVDISKKVLVCFVVSPKRCIVERTYAWANNSRRLSKDYEIKTVYQQNMFMI